MDTRKPVQVTFKGNGSGGCAASVRRRAIEDAGALGARRRTFSMWEESAADSQRSGAHFAGPGAATAGERLLQLDGTFTTTACVATER
jgi:hypothetical protein